MRSDWWKFNESMTSGTRPPVRYIRRGEEGVRASDLGPSENQATAKDARFMTQKVKEWLAKVNPKKEPDKSKEKDTPSSP